NPVLRDRRRLLDGAAITASAATTVILGVITYQTVHGAIVYWFAGFRPSHHVAVGIAFAADPDRRRPGGPRRTAGNRGDDLLLALLRARRDVLPRPHADIPCRYGWLLPDRRYLRHVRLVRAHGRVRVRAHRVPARRTRSAARRIELRDHQQRRRLPVIVGNSADLRPDRRAQHGADRPRPHRPPCRRSRGRLFSPDYLGLAGQGRDRAIPLLAGRRARRSAHAGLRAVLRSDG